MPSARRQIEVENGKGSLWNQGHTGKEPSGPVVPASLNPDSVLVVIDLVYRGMDEEGEMGIADESTGEGEDVVIEEGERPSRPVR